MVEKRNVVIIEAPGETARQIHQQLEAADQPIPQIMIEAIVCVVAPDKGLQFGFDWNHGLQVNGIDRLNVGCRDCRSRAKSVPTASRIRLTTLP